MARYEITDCPSKFDLMIALFDGAHYLRRLVKFSLADPPSNFREDRYFVLNGLHREDDSCENWQFEGYQATQSAGNLIYLGAVYGLLSTRNRKGWVEI